MGNIMNKLHQIGIFKHGPTMRSTLANDLPKDKDIEVVLEEPIEENILVEKQEEQNLLDEHQNCENVLTED